MEPAGVAGGSWAAFGCEALMSIYATLWTLKFPRCGDDHTGCAWISVIAQAVPAHIGRPAADSSGEESDSYASFLAGAAAASSDDDAQEFRAVVCVTEGTPKGTARSAQEYVRPLLVLSGPEYASITFGRLHEMICDVLRAHRPRLVAESWDPDGRGRLHFEDGIARDIQRGDA